MNQKKKVDMRFVCGNFVLYCEMNWEGPRNYSLSTRFFFVESICLFFSYVEDGKQAGWMDTYVVD